MRDETFDVAIVGGGVTGTGAALDAATRGLSVALIEQRDWAAGTSSRSSKLIHGGRVRLVIHDPIPTADLDRNLLNDLRDEVRAAIAEPLV